MGKKSRHREHRYRRTSSESDSDEDLQKDSRFFKEYAFHVSSLRLQWGMLTLDNIRELELSDEEFATMLMSQLDIRDTCIDALGDMLNELVEKGRKLEKHNRYLLQKIGDLEYDGSSRRKSKRDERRSRSKYPEEHSSSKSHRFSQDDNWRSSPALRREDDTVDESKYNKVRAMVAVALASQDKEDMKTDIKNEKIRSESIEREMVNALFAKVLQSECTKSKERSEDHSNKGNVKSDARNCTEETTLEYQNKEENNDVSISAINNFESSDRKKIKDLITRVLNTNDKEYTKIDSENLSPDRDRIKVTVDKDQGCQPSSSPEYNEKTDDGRKNENCEKDRFKAMVAMAFKAHGYGSQGSDADTHQKDLSVGAELVKNHEVKKGWDTDTGQSVTEQVKKVASEALEQSGYAYQEELGLYYDYSSGYYYNAENGLYYDPKTGTYFYYDHERQSYQFHSQVPVTTSSAAQANGTPSDSTASGDQENSALGSAEEGLGTVENPKHLWTGTENADGSKYGTSAQIPPSLRLMVTESGTENVQVGTLHLVTIDGGRVGRAHDNLIQLDDEIVSRVHAEFTYRSSGPEDHHYFIKDLGSALGTYINDTCISIPGEPSEDIEVGHGWELRFGTIKMKCHIHPGYLSCNECEPGLVMANLPSKPSQSKNYEPANIQKTRLKVVKAMKKKYALEYSNDLPVLPAEYKDRARKRRKEKGSDNPYEKTEVASTASEIKDTNKGFALMKKMGWSKGEALGKSQPGITAPIEAFSTVGREGLGFFGGLPPPTAEQRKRKQILDKTVQRYNKQI
ncbi:hypothetical protein SK128_010050 [Halocaridina rubra]|uniref:Angiogenic factor with G patch and FHA domains 1 n=1 Tax=Halocaridina rubra TaxID=373956 RepID=A0AAN8WNW3_HALRR